MNMFLVFAFIINAIINVLIYVYSDYFGSKWDNEQDDGSFNGWDRSRLWSAFMVVCPFFIYYFWLKWLIKESKKEEEKENQKNRIRQQAWKKRRK